MALAATKAAEKVARHEAGRRGHARVSVFNYDENPESDYYNPARSILRVKKEKKLLTITWILRFCLLDMILRIMKSEFG